MGFNSRRLCINQTVSILMVKLPRLKYLDIAFYQRHTDMNKGVKLFFD